MTSRLSLVEASRAVHRLRLRSDLPHRRLADAERAIDAVWARCEIWELTPAVCEDARRIAPHGNLRTLDALHLACVRG